ncbi:hypothetical protein L873DRAFT_459414 [Choiromyces venosus 120613-1]|uniref:Uncharacterized protein n=1 Tax=Choiromyces venosus 120613-1 TaxID=1336337 RepID=A0A3N4JVM4_9PEZI|nr:hypothetical protein L873DRAFT_459414 [Choiromyces venosus 120613-1]
MGSLCRREGRLEKLEPAILLRFWSTCGTHLQKRKGKKKKKSTKTALYRPVTPFLLHPHWSKFLFRSCGRSSFSFFTMREGGFTLASPFGAFRSFAARRVEAGVDYRSLSSFRAFPLLVGCLRHVFRTKADDDGDGLNERTNQLRGGQR